jgi:hypothetical protein
LQELIMTEHLVQNEPFHKRTTASWLPPRALVAVALLVVALTGATLSTQQSGLAQKTFVETSRSGAVAAVEPMRIVPADVFGQGASWSPLTGDGSN